MNDFFKTKVAFLIGISPVLWILAPFIVPKLKDVSIIVYNYTISSEVIYYSMITTILLSLFAYAFLFIKEGKLKSFKKIGNFFYPFFIILPCIFLLIYALQNAILPITNQLNPKILPPILFLVLIVAFIYITYYSSKKIDEMLKQVNSKSLDEILSLIDPNEFKLNFILKRTFDLFLCSVLLLYILPLLIVTSLTIQLESKGPILSSQTRIGQNGERFKLIKFRSIRNNNHHRKTNNTDMQLTVVGKIIRRLRIDELPKLLNILKGNISFIGPHPLRPHQEINSFSNQKVRDLYFSVKPGMVGLSDLKSSFLYNFQIEDYIKFDLFYIKSSTLKLDFMILFSAIKKVLFYSSEK